MDLSNARSRLCTNRTAVSMLSALITGVLFFNTVYIWLVDWLFFDYTLVCRIEQLLFADHAVIQMMWFESLNLSSGELQVVSGELTSVVVASDPSVLNTTHRNHCSVTSCTCSLRLAGVMRCLSSFEFTWQHSIAHLCGVSWKELASWVIPFSCDLCSDVWYVFVTHMIVWLIDYSFIICTVTVTGNFQIWHVRGWGSCLWPDTHII